jgi:selT/selW/selH-like putative selenoprotein
LEEEYGAKISLERGSGGCFEVTVDGRLVFSKLKEGRFPSEDEVMTAIGPR